MAETRILTTNPSQAEIEQLEKLYSFREPTDPPDLYTQRGREDVLNFIGKHPFLVSLLVEANGKIRSYFPAETLSLEVVSDPEILNDTALYIVIVSDLEVEEACNKLNQFNDGWWFNNFTRSQDKLRTILEYR